MTRRILILTADVGFGHLSAANAIRAALHARHGQTCRVDVVNPMRSQTTPRLMQHNAREYDHLVRRWPRLYGLAYSATNRRIMNSLVNQAYTSLLQASLQRILASTTPHLVITTYPYYQSPLATICRALVAPPRLMTVVTDFVTVHRAWFHESADLCCVPTTEAARCARGYGFTADKIRVTGIPVHPDIGQMHASKTEMRRQLEWDTDLPTMLVMGSKRVKRLPGLLKQINAARLPLQLAIVCGGDETLHAALKQMTWTRPTHLFGFSEQVPQFMHAADWVMSKAGGLTTAEALACARPLLFIDTIPGQERGNADYVTRHGAGVMAGTDAATVRLLRHWTGLGDAEPRRLSAAARRLGRAHAAYDVADHAWTLLQPTDNGVEIGQARRGPVRLQKTITRRNNEAGIHE